MALPKKAKRNQAPASAAATLDELESLGDRTAQWLNDNSTIVLAVGAAILVVGGGIGLIRSSQENSKLEASAELAAVERDFRTAMGANPGDTVIREPANPETAQNVRTEYIERFRAVAEAHAGDTAGALALLEVGSLQEQLGQPDEALETWKAAAEELDSGNTLKALLSLRIAVIYEDQARWVEAAQAFETAAAVQSFPLRYGALADAARCFAEAGEIDRALAAFARVETEAPDFFVPQHVDARLRELRAANRLRLN